MASSPLGDPCRVSFECQVTLVIEGRCGVGGSDTFRKTEKPAHGVCSGNLE